MNISHGKKKDSSKAVSIIVIIWPLIAAIAVLHIGIIFMIISINDQSAVLSQTMQNSSRYVSEVSSLMARTSMLVETSSNYILMPENEDGTVNFGSVTAFSEELKTSETGAEISAKINSFDVSDEVRGLISSAGEASDEMVKMELHALALVNSVYPLPDIPPLAALALPELTEEEKALTDEQRISAARQIVLGGDFTQKKATVSTNTRGATASIQQAAGRVSGEKAAYVARLRTWLWILTALVIILVMVSFAIVFRLLITPLGKFVDLIQTDRMMPEKKGVKEIRLVASAYNSLMRRRDAMDNLLRYAAETDSLTNLPNRYGFEQYLLEVEEQGDSMAVMLFDVNYLKETNDTYGHDAGDRLLKQTAECISECFGSETDNNCFRFGGDEFAAVIKNSDPVQIEGMVEKFEEVQKQHNISVSWGYAYTEESGSVSIKELIKEADTKMYVQKKRMHETGTGTEVTCP